MDKPKLTYTFITEWPPPECQYPFCDAPADVFELRDYGGDKTIESIVCNKHRNDRPLTTRPSLTGPKQGGKP